MASRSLYVATEKIKAFYSSTTRRRRIFTNTISLVQADKLKTLIDAAGVPDVEQIWCTLFAKALEGKDVKELLLNVGSGGGAAAAPAAAGGAAAGGDAPAEEAKEEKKEEAAEESDEDMGFGLFD